jgi:penicillin-binding protein 1A
VFEPVTDWPKAPPLTRPQVRLYLPGVECLFRAVSTATTVPADGDPETPTPDGDGVPDGDVTDQAPPATDPATAPPAEPTPTVPPAEPPPTGTTIPVAPTETTAPPAPVYRAIDSGTTIPPDVLDPRAPLPSAPRSVYVAPCR